MPRGLVSPCEDVDLQLCGSPQEAFSGLTWADAGFQKSALAVCEQIREAKGPAERDGTGLWRLLK